MQHLLVASASQAEVAAWQGLKQGMQLSAVCRYHLGCQKPLEKPLAWQTPVSSCLLPPTEEGCRRRQECAG